MACRNPKPDSFTGRRKEKGERMFHVKHPFPVYFASDCPECVAFSCRAAGMFGLRRVSLAGFVPVFREERDHLAVEGGKVLRAAAAHPVAVPHHLRVLPQAPCVPDVVLDRVVARQAPSPDKSGGDKQPRAVTDHGDRLMRAIDLSDELPGLLSMRRASALRAPPGSSTASNSAASTSSRVLSTRKVSAFLAVAHPLDGPAMGRDDHGLHPASSSAFLGSVISTCSNASVTMIATFIPSSALPAMLPPFPRGCSPPR